LNIKKFFFFEETNMNYINTDTEIVTAQGVPKQSREEYSQVNHTQHSIDAHT